MTPPAPMAPIPYPSLVGRRTGIVSRVEPYPVPEHLPPTLRLFTSVIADTTRFGPWRSDSSGMGAVLWDDAAAIAAALGEAVERYCGNLVPPGLTEASYRELLARGQRAVSPAQLALYAPAQYATPGFPFVPFTPDLPVRWVRGRDVLDHQPVWVPASLVWTSYFEAGRTRTEPRTNGTIYAGIAAGLSRQRAEWSALCELIERDAMTLTWTSGAAGHRLDPPDWLARLACGPTRALQTRFCSFPHEVGLPVVGALMLDQRDGYLTLGTACRPDPLDAMLKAVAEAAHIQVVMRELDDPTSAIAQLGDLAASPLKPWRRERDYLSVYRADWHDATDPGCHMQAYLDPRLADQLITEIESWPEQTRSQQPWGRAVTGTGQGTSQPPGEPFTDAARQLGRQGISVCSVDVTTDDVRSAGLHVVRLVAAGLYSNGPAAFPFLGGDRLQQRRKDILRPPRLQPLPH